MGDKMMMSLFDNNTVRRLFRMEPIEVQSVRDSIDSLTRLLDGPVLREDVLNQGRGVIVEFGNRHYKLALERLRHIDEKTSLAIECYALLLEYLQQIDSKTADFRYENGGFVQDGTEYSLEVVVGSYQRRNGSQQT